MLLRPGGLTAPRGLRVPLLLDNVVGLAAAFSLRQVISNFANPIVDVRRGSDNATASVGFTAEGVLDSAALLAFAGSADVFVTRWYDQSIYARHVIQTVTSRQPKIVEAGVLVVDAGGKPAIRFPGSTDSLENLTFQQSQPFAYHAVWRPVTIVGHGGGDVLVGSNSAGPYASFSCRADRVFIFAGGSVQKFGDPRGFTHASTVIFDGASSLVRDNGGEVTGDAGTSQDPRTAFAIGAYAGFPSQASDTLFQEVIVRDGHPSAASIATIEADQQAFYSL